VTNQLDKVKHEITRLEVAIKTSERDLNKSKDKLEAYEAEVVELQNKLKELSEAREAISEQNKTLQTEVDEFKVMAVASPILRLPNLQL
jgi:structural maintenance of chromosome 4